MVAADMGDPTGGSLAICIVLFVAIFSKEILSHVKIKIPFTIFMLMAGIFMEIFVSMGTCEVSADYTGNETICVDLDVRSKCEATPECNFEASFYGKSGNVDLVYHSMDVWTSMDPHLIMYTFLPALIYASSSSLSFHVFMKSLSTIAVLAGPGVLIATMLTALLVHTFQPDGYDWTWTSAIGFGAMISATDPVAVVALLKEMNAPTNLGVIIEGESLFNDGTAFAFFLICFEGLKGTERSVSESIGFFAQLAFGGLALGYVLGFILIRFLKHTNEGLIEVVSTLVFAYGTFIIAEEIHVSGVLAVVALGLQMSQNGKPHLSDEQIMHHFWELMEFIANVVIFAICGFHIANAFLSTSDIRDGFGSAVQNLGFTFAIFIFTLLVRVINLALLTPVLRFAGYGVQFGEQVVMAWAGLRGAVSLTLAAMIAQTKLSDFECDIALEGGCTPDNENTRLELFASRMLYHCAGVTFLTLVVNGTTTGSLLKYFKIGIQCVASKHAFDRIVRDLSNGTEQQLEFLKDAHPFFEHCNLDLIYDLLPVFNEEMLEERLKSGKVSAARYKMIDESPFFRTMRQHYEDHGDVGSRSTNRKRSKENKNAKKRTTVVGGQTHLVHHALLRHTSSGNFENPQDTAETLLADPRALAEFSQSHWGEIVETRRRALLMLSSSYWNNFERGFTTSSVIGFLMDAADTAMDRQRRAPKYAPSLEEWDNYTVSSWEALESSMKMSFFRKTLIWILKKLPFETAHTWARYMFHYSFERTIDIANSFAIGHHSLERRLHKMAKTSSRVRSDPTLCHIHSLDPVVLEIVAAEVRVSSEAAKDLVRSAVQANNELLKSVASKQAARYLLKGIVKAVEHEHEIGEIDDTEKSMLETCTKFCMLRLNRGAMLAPPPSIDSFLRRIPFLKNLDKCVLEAIADVSKERHIISGSMLFKQKRTRAHGLHLVLGGRVAVFAKRTTGTTPKQRGKKNPSRWSITNGTRWSITDIAKAVITGKNSSIGQNNLDNNDEEIDHNNSEEKKDNVREKKGAPLTSRWSITDMIQNVRKKSRHSESQSEIESNDLGKCAMILEKGNEILGTLSWMTGELHYMSAQAQSMVLSLYIPAWCVNKIFASISEISIGPDDHFLDAPTQGRRHTKKGEHDAPTRMLSNIVGFGSDSESEEEKQNEDQKEDEDEEEDEEGKEELPMYPVDRTSRISFTPTNSFEIPEMDAVVFCEGIAKNACLQACLTVLEYDVVSTFKLRALDLQAQITKMCERAVYMKVRPNETVYLPRPAVLITGHLERVYAGQDEKCTKYSGIPFLPNSNPNGDRVFNDFVYKATNQLCESDSIERNVQLVMFDEADVANLSLSTRMRRRLVKSFSSTFMSPDGEKKAKVAPTEADESVTSLGGGGAHRRRQPAKRKHSLFGRIFTSHVFHNANQHGPQTHRG